MSALLTACGSPTPTGSEAGSALPNARPGEGKPPVTIGTKNYTEQLILGPLYAQALEAKGYTVHLKSGIGPTEVIDKELTRGQIDLYPEYTDVINSVVATFATLTAPGAPVRTYAPPTTREESYRQAYAFEKSRGFTLLDAAPYENGVRVAVTPAFAKEHGLATTAELSKLPSFTFGAPPELQNRYEGLRGLQQSYGLGNAVFVPYPPGAQYAALTSGKVDTAAVLLTDGQLTQLDLVLLSDPKNVFGFQNVAPVVNSRKLADLGSEFAATLNAVSAELTTPVMRRMNAEVDLGHKDPALVAHEFLTANSLA